MPYVARGICRLAILGMVSFSVPARAIFTCIALGADPPSEIIPTSIVAKLTTEHRALYPGSDQFVIQKRLTLGAERGAKPMW
jgi:hypothetical protein